MTNRTKALAALLLLTTAVAVIFFLNRGISSPANPAQRTMSPEFTQAFARIQAAEKISDSNERCLAYPDPPWLKWDQNLIKAFCQSRAFSYIKLSEIKTALDAHHPEQVDAAFQELLNAHFTDPSRHGILTRAYRELFGNSAQQVRDTVEEWVRLDPKSAFALAARGCYYQSAASSARGGDFAQMTPQENMLAMHKLASDAVFDLQAAVRLEPKLSSAYDAMMNTGLLIGDRLLMSQALKAALAIDPTNERFYLDWMVISAPKWYGSLADMAHVADEAQKHVGQNPLLRLLLEKQHAYFGEMAQDQHDYAGALDYFDKAFADGPSPVDLGDAAHAAGALGQFEKAVWYYSESYRFDRQSAAANLESRAWALGQLRRPDLAKEDLANLASLESIDEETLWLKGDGASAEKKFPEAEKFYLRVLQLNPRHEFALVHLAELYVGPLKKPDKAEPLVAELQELYPVLPRTWLLTSILARGKDPDEKQCIEAMQRYLSLVDDDDASEKEDIGRVRSRLKELAQRPITRKPESSPLH